MFDTLPAQIGAVFVVLIGVFAFVKGDEPERVGAGTVLLGWFASLLVQRDGQLYGVQWGMFAIDTICLIVFGALVWKSRRNWPVWACGLQALSVMTHIMLMLDIRPPMQSFFTVINLAGYGILVAIAVGTFYAWQERKAAGLE
ncbi:hypothetical protein ASG17_06720 [Brevundimonas sp. Leaf363]|uniref:hypothetical protein n=1 Tax=Brevundimonas sp. Leaf363 TaxID=1736353 RepID=UPI0006F52938|nr:hypothetical protein [Brevundimonas sp. Leaf363]KQS55750.1 hypothetical protein ASG17_06720 [Brevundimonas sp. Leaf363]